jgi:hypothetical protein
MGKLSDVLQSMRNMKGFVSDAREIKNAGMKEISQRSLARQSSAATLQFPVVISKAITLETAQTVTKALERQYAIFVQMVISLNPYLDLSKDSIPSYLGKIHQNNPNVLDLLNESCTSVYSDEAYELYVLMSINEGCNGQVLKSNAEQMFSVEEFLNPNKVNDLYKPKTITRSVAESSLDYFCKKNHIVMEADDDAIDFMDDDEPSTMHNNGRNTNDRDYRLKLDQLEFQRMKQIEDRQDKRSLQRDSQNFQDAQQRAKFQHDIEKAQAEYKSKTMVKLSDNDVKKANELVPTTLSVSLQVKDGQSFGGITNFVLGIKGLMHPVNSNDMISNLIDGYKSGNKFFNFIRWTTGEISFLKDLLFNVNGIKEDVIKKHTKGNSHWWSTLKRRRTLAKMKNAFGGSKILPNVSIVCSMEEVAEMQDVYGMDLMEPKTVRRMMDRYFLLGFVVVDEAQELCHFIFDGESNYQTLSFKGLEKENNNKNEFKEIYKMINSGRL